jgi:hypothetical protein
MEAAESRKRPMAQPPADGDSAGPLADIQADALKTIW